MLAGELYDGRDPQLVAERSQARRLIPAFNDAGEDHLDERKRALKALIPDSGADVWIEPPFRCDYGSHITLGDRVYFNFDCVILDVSRVRIGAGTLFGPSVHVYAATHPMEASVRRTFLEAGKEVTIGEDCWIGGGAIICPGVTIGDRTVIGAGSVVTRDIPSDVFAAGNPCRVIREISDTGDISERPPA